MTRIPGLAALAIVAVSADATLAAGALPTWLEGCWRRDGAQTVTVERWLEPSDDALFGISETRRDGATAAWEFLRIAAGDDGAEYLAWPSGQQPTVFRRAPGAAGEWVFENPGHDFPQRIVYPEPVEGRLEVRIEGLRDGAPRVIGFPMRRVPCDEAWGADRPDDGEVEGAGQSG